MRTNLLQSVSSVSLLPAKLSSFRAVTSLPAKNVQSTWLNLGREATLYTMKPLMEPQTPVRKLPPERGAVQRIRAVRPRGPSRRPSPLRILVENARLRGGSVLFADNVSIFLTKSSNPTCLIWPFAAYTSLLRISTTPPTKDVSDDEHRGSTSIDDHENEQDDVEGNDGTGPVSVTTDPLSAAPGGMMNTLRSGFRNLTLSSTTRPENETLPRDVERGLGAEAVAA